jgi:MEDS: MEthanogen/methylotroph, DcmR Sensory domain
MLVVSTEVRETGVRDHVVQFYERDEHLVDGVGNYLAGALERGDAVVVVATPAHLGIFAVRLQSMGVDIGAAQRRGQFMALDAAATMDAFLVDGWPDPVAFDVVLGGLVRRAQASGRQVCIFGEMVALLWAAGQVNAAIELERLWNRLADDVPFSLLCAYSKQLLAGANLLAEFDQLCHLHSAIVGQAGADVDAGAMGGASRTFTRSPDAPRAARHFVLTVLDEWGAGHLRDDAALVVTELTTNAVLHARSSFRVVVSAAPASVRISVADDSPVAPGRQDFSLAGNSGRGLGLVSAVCRQWGTTHLEAGKVVWAELRR